MWLRLVQSARDREEQNLEAYIKNGQLFYRSLRRIEKDEELLVWYGKELVDLLLLNASRAPAKTKGTSEEGAKHSTPSNQMICSIRIQIYSKLLLQFVRETRCLIGFSLIFGVLLQVHPTIPVQTAARSFSMNSHSWPILDSVVPRDYKTLQV